MKNGAVRRQIALWMAGILLVAAGFVYVGGTGKAYADSPLTSTGFYEAYKDIPGVEQAADGGLTKELAAYLSSADNPLDERAAAVNALYASSNVWSDQNKTDTYAQLAYGKSEDELQTGGLRGDELFVLGYMKVLDHYFEPDMTLLTQARKALPDSMTVALVYALGMAQLNIECSWTYVEQTLGDSTLKTDIRQTAIDIITDYMVLYNGGACTGSLPSAGELVTADELRQEAVALLLGQSNGLVRGTNTVTDAADSTIVPYAVKGTTLVPLRFVSQALGAVVGYDSAAHQATVSSETASLMFITGQKRYTVNGVSHTLATPVESRNGRVFVPLRAIAESLQKQVFYDNGLIIITNHLKLDSASAYDRQLVQQIRSELEQR
ncbi:stalk domain-containing protein [Paenibacillus kobensis]|uniref:stalk domain-containing protein n=1 Tax=Paenibacillus kobensis TaxID=59841 RepID=UPI000FD74B44|nr:stalk domain-containing protein [Paenibacillus kobensis]